MSDWMRMPQRQLPVFEVLLEKRGRVWTWRVCTAEGQLVMRGVERRRPSARYKANRALFQMLLCAPYACTPNHNGDRSKSNSGRSRSSI